VIDQQVVAALDSASVRFCLIGAQALAVLGLPRFTADIDFLTMDARVLVRSFWGEELGARIVRLARGDDDDPLGGIVRFGSPRAVDVIVGRGRLMREAVDTAALDVDLGVRVPSPLHLALLKLDAGGLQDITDIHRLIEIRRPQFPDEDLVGQIEARATSLSDWGQQAWARLKSMAADEAARPRGLRAADD